MQPGGKRDVGESDVAALSAKSPRNWVAGLGTRAHGRWVCSIVRQRTSQGFRSTQVSMPWMSKAPIKPAGEIDQFVWIDPHALPDLLFAPLTRDHVLPLARSLQ